MTRSSLPPIPLDLVEQVDEPEQIADAQADPARRQHNPRIGRGEARPTHRDADGVTLLEVKGEPVLTPQPLTLGKIERLAEPRVERMGDADPLTRILRDGRTPSSR